MDSIQSKQDGTGLDRTTAQLTTGVVIIDPRRMKQTLLARLYISHMSLMIAGEPLWVIAHVRWMTDGSLFACARVYLPDLEECYERGYMFLNRREKHYMYVEKKRMLKPLPYCDKDMLFGVDSKWRREYSRDDW